MMPRRRRAAPAAPAAPAPAAPPPLTVTMYAVNGLTREQFLAECSAILTAVSTAETRMAADNLVALFFGHVASFGTDILLERPDFHEIVEEKAAQFRQVATLPDHHAALARLDAVLDATRLRRPIPPI
jgi:hypothetical protein